MLLGILLARLQHFDYRAGTVFGWAFNPIRLYHVLMLPEYQFGVRSPTTPDMQRLIAITHARFSLFRFRSPLLSESLLFSLPTGTEMFHFPAFPSTALFYSDGEDWT